MSTFTEAVEVLVIRRTQKVHPNDPQAYGATLRKDLRHRLHDDAKAILAEEPNIDPTDLADLLDPGSNVAPATTTAPGPPQPDTYEPEAWKPLDEDGHQRAKRRIDEIRAGLRGGEV